MNPVLLTLVAGLTASLMGFLSGSVLLKYKGDRALVLFVPVMEETLQTLAAGVFYLRGVNNCMPFAVWDRHLVYSKLLRFGVIGGAGGVGAAQPVEQNNDSLYRLKESGNIAIGLRG